MKFRRETLDNGLEVVAEVNDEAHSMGIGYFVRTGSRDESVEVAGVSHFLEHMLFKGTPARSADDVNREFDELGAHYNAFTSEESTVYYASVLPEYQHRVVDLLSDIMRPSLRQEDFETEKQVILEEIQMYADQPPFGMDDRIKELHFGDHPIARSVLGTIQSVEALSVGQMRDYFERRYSAANVFVAASGRVDFEGLVEQLHQTCSGWRRGDAARATPPSRSHPSCECVHRPEATQQYVLQLGDAPAAEDDSRYAAKVLATMLGDDSGSRLYWELIDTGLAETASLGHYEYQGVGMFFLWLSCGAEEAQDNLDRITAAQQLAEAEGFRPEELMQAKSKLKARVVLGSERPRNRLFNVGGNWLQRRKHRTVEEDLAAVDSVTLDDVSEVLRRYPLTKRTTAAIGPLETMSDPASAR
ncbi:MAG: pitrilysin family protein [Planctomycetota bacterium]